MEILNKIKEQIEWYYNNSEKAWINDLILLQDRLAWNSFYLAELYSLAYTEYLEKVYNTKTKKIKTFLTKKSEKIADKQLTDKLAEKFAEDESLWDWSNELFWEWEKEKYRILLQQVNIILQAIQQRISYMKKEKDLTNK